MSDKIREEFEAWAVTRRNIYNLPFFVFARNEDGSYTDGTAEYAWEGWKASRESLFIELPQQSGANPSWNQAIRYCHQAIEAAGLKVKP